MDIQMPRYQPADVVVNPYPSPTTDADSPLPSSSSPPAVIQIPPESIDPLEAVMGRVTDEELERLEDAGPLTTNGEATDVELVPRSAPPLPLEHIYVHDENYPLRLTDFEVMETLGE